MQISIPPYKFNLSQPTDLSLAVGDVARAWYIAAPEFVPVQLGDSWVGSIEAGGQVNFFDVHFNPHAHGTHTECLGHVTRERHSVNRCFSQYFFLADVVSVYPETHGGDEVITEDALKKAWQPGDAVALIIRTLPNLPGKAIKNYSQSNWPYLSIGAATFIRHAGILHLLIDQPSVDKEEDGGALAAHKAFWNIPDHPRHKATITELIDVPDSVADGRYLLNLQVAPLENDASPSRPVIFPLL